MCKLEKLREPLRRDLGKGFGVLVLVSNHGIAAARTQLIYFSFSSFALEFAHHI